MKQKFRLILDIVSYDIDRMQKIIKIVNTFQIVEITDYSLKQVEK